MALKKRSLRSWEEGRGEVLALWASQLLRELDLSPSCTFVESLKQILFEIFHSHEVTQMFLTPCPVDSHSIWRKANAPPDWLHRHPVTVSKWLPWDGVLNIEHDGFSTRITISKGKGIVPPVKPGSSYFHVKNYTLNTSSKDEAREEHKIVWQFEHL